jgi:hypothetical protein
MRDIIYSAAKFVKSDQRDIERTCARVFSSADGQKVLNYLQVLAFHRVYGAESAPEQLHYAEGGRAMIANILRLIEKGRNAS